MAKPCDTDPLPQVEFGAHMVSERYHLPHDLVSRYDIRLMRCEVTLGDV
ncbi:Uncharacterised protein [Mycobacteroides abscessus subsp. abscessus]|nr:Uncharacterised protein [Mycobacteroides abscessus subsp. abscessus]SLF34277.1 Uncharacterised protein [Mycobacteroides abscessus subsp. massiliense]